MAMLSLWYGIQTLIDNNSKIFILSSIKLGPENVRTASGIELFKTKYAAEKKLQKRILYALAILDYGIPILIFYLLFLNSLKFYIMPIFDRFNF